MSEKKLDPYQDGEVPADADISDSEVDETTTTTTEHTESSTTTTSTE